MQDFVSSNLTKVARSISREKQSLEVRLFSGKDVRFYRIICKATCPGDLAITKDKSVETLIRKNGPFLRSGHTYSLP